MFNNGVLLKGNTVAPFAGAWIEMITNTMFRFRMLSLPSRERGLKWQWQQRADAQKDVAPFAGAWIEIKALLLIPLLLRVAPFAGAWIEITSIVLPATAPWSLPSRERGLKWHLLTMSSRKHSVAPFAGAWIEIRFLIRVPLLHKSLPSRERGLKSLKPCQTRASPCRSLRGSVD